MYGEDLKRQVGLGWGRGRTRVGKEVKDAQQESQEEKQKQACKEECKFEQKLLLTTTHRHRGWDECPKIPLEDETSSRVPVAPHWRPAGWAKWAPG